MTLHTTKSTKPSNITSSISLHGESHQGHCWESTWPTSAKHYYRSGAHWQGSSSAWHGADEFGPGWFVDLWPNWQHFWRLAMLSKNAKFELYKGWVTCSITNPNFLSLWVYDLWWQVVSGLSQQNIFIQFRLRDLGTCCICCLKIFVFFCSLGLKARNT